MRAVCNKESSWGVVTGQQSCAMPTINTVIIKVKGHLSLFSCREWKRYFKDPYNYFDWLGLVLTFLVIPLRFAEVKSQWSVAALGYLFNFLRLFKFSCVSRYCLLVQCIVLTLFSYPINERVLLWDNLRVLR